ncbi:MAG TPA: DNA translocase FtsK [Candidatus Sulfotelmatobacter sp.]
MGFLTTIVTPTTNRRLNELIGFLMCVSALLLFLALASYSPLDPSLNSASVLTGSHAARNWIGVIGALVSDIALQFFGIGSFLLPIIAALLGARWFRSLKIQSPIAKTLGGIWLVMFFPALLALLPGHLRWMRVIPVEGLLGRIIGDFLIHYLNLIGAYIVCGTLIAVALYLSTAFSFAAVRLWAPTRFAFATALWNRYLDWQLERVKQRQQKELEKRRISKPVVKTQLIPSRPANFPTSEPNEIRRTGIERMMSDESAETTGRSRTASGGILADAALADADTMDSEPEVSLRADSSTKAKTTMPRIAGGYKLPPSSLLQRPDERQAVDAEELKLLAQVLREKYAEFEVHGQVTQINPGPVVTTFEFKPEAGIKYSRVTNLCDDLCLALKAESILIERMAGKSTVGIQVPNREREIIWLRENIESQEFMGSKSKMTIAMGKDINGRIVTADLAGMPHLLIAGSTGAGKSVAINAMIMSILYKATPDQVRLILVDPKRLELGNYEGVPHLHTPIITEPKLAANALRNAVREMERRLKLLAAKGVRNIDQYNRLFDQSDTPSLFDEGDEKPLPYIVIIIDELADLMMLDSSNVEESITRLAQMARAVGIHLVLATQRPSVDVITGLIKANFPARVSFRVATKVDSRTILDANGAEALLGKGDMLYLPSGSARVHRLHAPFVTEKEIAAVVEFWKAQGAAEYQSQFLEAPKDEREPGSVAVDGEAGLDGEPEDDPLFADAVKLVVEFGKASTSLLQRRLRIGYGRAAHLIDLMEQDGIVGAADGPKPRELLKRPDWISEIEESMR